MILKSTISKKPLIRIKIKNFKGYLEKYVIWRNNPIAFLPYHYLYIGQKKQGLKKINNSSDYKYN